MQVKQIVSSNIILPKLEVIQPIHSSLLTLSNKLLNLAKYASILPKLASLSLVSLEQQYDDNYQIILDREKLHAFK